MVKRICLWVSLLGITSCTDLDVRGLILSTSAGVDSRFEESVRWSDEHAETVLSVPTSEYRFYVCADIHARRTAKRFSSFLRVAQEDENSCFSLVLGDMVTGDGSFPMVADTLSAFRRSVEAPDTLFSTVGNHDLMFGQWGTYRDLLGISTYFFEVRTPLTKDLFISIDSGSGSLGLKQLKWLSRLLAFRRGNYRHCIIFTHVNLFKTGNAQTSSGNLPAEEVYALTELCARNEVKLLLQGHDHVRGERKFKGTTYLVLDALSDESKSPSYCVVTCGDDVRWSYNRNI